MSSKAMTYSDKERKPAVVDRFTKDVGEISYEETNRELHFIKMSDQEFKENLQKCRRLIETMVI